MFGVGSKKKLATFNTVRITTVCALKYTVRVHEVDALVYNYCTKMTQPLNLCNKCRDLQAKFTTSELLWKTENNNILQLECLNNGIKINYWTKQFRSVTNGQKGSAGCVQRINGCFRELLHDMIKKRPKQNNWDCLGSSRRCVSCTAFKLSG